MIDAAKPTPTRIPLRRLLSISEDDVDRERKRRQQEAHILIGYFAGDNRFGACPAPLLTFHRDRRLNRILIGANKSAKTIGGTVDVALQCAGRHPFRRRLRPPIAARAVCPELPGTMDKPHVQRDTFREWVPEAWLRGGSWDEAYAVGAHTLHFANGSFVEFLSWEQRPVVHAGERRHLIWFDEEGPREVFQENLARLAKGLVLGEYLFTYVPVEGLTWIEQELYQPALEERLPNTGLHHVTIFDNAHNLPEGFIEQFIGSLGTDADVLVRAHGAYGVREGRVFATFGKDHAVAGEMEVVAG